MEVHLDVDDDSATPVRSSKNGALRARDECHSYALAGVHGTVWTILQHLDWFAAGGPSLDLSLQGNESHCMHSVESKLLLQSARECKSLWTLLHHLQELLLVAPAQI